MLFFTSLCQASTHAYDREWLDLLYYEKTNSGYESVADGQPFFLTPEGKTSPNAEYQAALRLATTQDPGFKSTFPLRYKWLCKHHNIAYLPMVKPDPKVVSMTIAFPNRYMDNPSSMFGHVILILNSKHGLMDSDIFHYLADTGRTNPRYYIFYGMNGRFIGRFLKEPYFKKIKDYTYVEDRDITYYDLNLNADQLENFQLHTLELKNTHFNYYFLDQNCAFFIGKSLNVILDHPVIEHPLIAAPSEIIQSLSKHDYILREYQRASITGQFTRRYQRLTSRQKKEVLALLTQEQIAPPTDTEVLETFITVSEHILNNATNLTQGIRSNRVKAYTILQEQHRPPVRASLVEQQQVHPIPAQAFQLGYGFKDQSFIGYRRINYSNPSSGSPFEDKTLITLAPRLVVTDRSAPQLDITLADIVSVAPYTQVLQTSSWKVNSFLGLRSEGLIHHHALDVGRAYPITATSYLSGFIGGTFSNYNPLIEQPLPSAEFSLGAQGLYTTRFSKNISAQLGYGYRYRGAYLNATIGVRSGSFLHAATLIKTDDFYGIKVSSLFEF